MTTDLALEVQDARKSFGPVRALQGVNLRLQRGEILALLGDNGAGKSTLIKAISGVHQLDEGKILVEGKSVSMKSPADARKLGIETVYQDLAVFDNLSVMANLFVGRERTWPRALRSVGFLRERAMKEQWREFAQRLQVVIPNPAQPLGLMSGGQRQAVAVARAVSFASRVVILDEPTAALGLRESGQVLNLIKRLPEQGVSVILISHNMEHVMQVADRALVLRQGIEVGEARPTPDQHERLVSMIVGASRPDELDNSSETPRSRASP
jgi:ABC-type sugar transport system ATPase subunit